MRRIDGSAKAQFAAALAAAVVIVLAAAVVACGARAAESHDRYLLINVHPTDVTESTLAAIAALKAEPAPHAPRLGVGTIFSYLQRSPEATRRALAEFLALAERHELAVVVQLDGEQWWNGRPDLWNWWEESAPGFDPANAANVEWSGWSPDDALKIAWRNWGRQVRVLPPPNLMSPQYQAAWREGMRPLVEQVVRWRDGLPPEKRWLFVGVKVGWESAIGMGSHYYPDGNALLERDAALDPLQRIKPEVLPGRGFAPIGYAAVSMAGLAHEGELQEAHLAEVVRRHLHALSEAARAGGLRREEVFTHGGGWKEGELLYASAVNEHSCPGWSFYRHGRDPAGDATAMAALAASDAPYWGAVEWLPVGARTPADWQAAVAATLAAPRCRYLCLYNWRNVEQNEAALDGLRAALRGD